MRAVLLLLACAPMAGGCTDTCVTKTGNPGDSCDLQGIGGDGGLPGLDDLIDPTDNPVLVASAEACGLDVSCEGGGIARGSAAVSGVPSIDAYFGAVLQLQAQADHVSAGIDAELHAIAAAFGIASDVDLAAALRTRIDAHVDGGLRVEGEPARCYADVGAALDAKAQCEGEVDAGGTEVECGGRCELQPSASNDCGADVDLECTFTAPATACGGLCSGRCAVELDSAAPCDGTCVGSCEGECSAYADAEATRCAGRCDGMCSGSCETELAAAACDGTCTGECSVTEPDGGCEGAVRASCRPRAGAMVMCQGRCAGDVRPPSASVECEAVVRAHARMHVECTPPRVVIDYRLRSGLDAEAAARFEVGMQRLRASLPALLAGIARAQLLVDAGEGLVQDAGGALEAGISAAGQGAAEGDLRVLFGIHCAIGEAGKVPGVLGGPIARVSASAIAVADIAAVLDP